MKRHTLTFSAIIAGLLALATACQKEIFSTIPEGAVVLTSESHQSGDKTSVSGTSVQWIGDGSENVTINGSDYTVNVSGETAYILPGTGNTPTLSAPIYGYYACGEVTNPSTTSPTVTVPDSYNCIYANGRQVLALPMVAYSSVLGNSIQFKQVTSAAKVMVRNEFSGVTMVLDKVEVSCSNYKLSGTVNVGLQDNNGEPTVAPQTAASSNTVTVRFSDSPVITTSGIEVQVPILPIGGVNNTDPDITIKVYAHASGDAGHTYTYTIENVGTGLVLARNEMFTVKCRMASGTGHVEEPRAEYLTFEAKTVPATVTFKKSPSETVNMLQYSIDGLTWNTYTEPISLANVGDKVFFRGDNTTLATNNTDRTSSIFTVTNGDCYLYGNIMSLLDPTDYPTGVTLTESYTFCNLFKGNSTIFFHPTKKLLLPATTLTMHCYCAMFYGCTNLTTAPELPAMTLAGECYYQMFRGCTGLTNAPALPATTLANGCYQAMFWGCTGLTEAPELSVMTLQTNCYQAMFRDCTSLIQAPELPATSLAKNCYNSMFYGCTGLSEAPELPATTLAESCYKYMFSRCTSITTAPELRATTRASESYYNMFEGCSNLNRVTCLLTDVTASTTISNWLNGVAATGTFTKAAGITWKTSSTSGIPSGWTVVDYQQ